MLRRPAGAQKKFLAALFDACIEQARQQDLLSDADELAAVDSTGLETGHISTYFGQRSGRKYHRYPKVSQVVDIRSHLALAAVVDRGPKPDDIEFHAVVRQAHARHPFPALAADVGYDGEHHHRFLNGLGVLGIIPPRRPQGPRRTPAPTERFASLRSSRHLLPADQDLVSTPLKGA